MRIQKALKRPSTFQVKEENIKNAAPEIVMVKFNSEYHSSNRKRAPVRITSQNNSTMVN